MTIIYNKLVRDKVPEKLVASGQRPILTLVLGQEKLDAMCRKIVEEANELSSAETREAVTDKLADLLEIIAAYRNELGINALDVSAAMQRRMRTDGGFQRGKFLLSSSSDSILDTVRRRI